MNTIRIELSVPQAIRLLGQATTEAIHARQRSTIPGMEPENAEAVRIAQSDWERIVTALADGLGYGHLPPEPSLSNIDYSSTYWAASAARRPIDLMDSPWGAGESVEASRG
jgi:hypothetical protein